MFWYVFRMLNGCFKKALGMFLRVFMMFCARHIFSFCHKHQPVLEIIVDSIYCHELDMKKT